MNEATSVKRPVGFWIVAVLALLWNGFGGFDYVMTRTRNMEYLAQAGDATAMLQWIDSMPIWAQVAWPVGVWGSLLGSVLLLLRSRHAVSAFAVSLLGALISFGHQFASTPPAALDTTANKLIPLVIMAIIIGLWWYSRRALGKGLLR